MSKTKTRTLTEALVIALNANEREKVHSKPEDNPYHSHDLKALTAGVRKSMDNHPARQMAGQGEIGYEMEVARNAALREGKADTGAKRKAQARARAARKVEFDKIADSPVRPSAARMTDAWYVVAPLVPTITQIANGKRRWAARLLGDVMDDVAQDVRVDVATLLAKSDKDLVLLRKAAEQLGDKQRKAGQVPGEQLFEDERKERKELGKARKWLMQVVNNRVHGILVDTYFRSHNIKAVNIDIIASIMASISGVGDDPLTARFKADRAPAFLGTKFQKPDGIDSGALAMAISAAITEKGLDRLVEFLLDDENRRVDGAVKWTECAEAIFKCGPDGEWVWDQVVAATTGLDRKKRAWDMDRARAARGKAAREWVRSEFEWLPNFVVSVMDAFDPHPIGFAGSRGRKVDDQAGKRWVMASDFELYYLADAPEVRQMLCPKLRYGSVEEAAGVLVEHLGALVTGEDLVMDVVNE